MSTILKNKEIAAQVKEKNVPFVLDAQAVLGLITRIAGKEYADKFEIVSIEPLQTGLDRYRLSDLPDGKILLEATSGVAAAGAFRWYLENRCNSYVGPLSRRLDFPQNPPKIGEAYTSNSICLYRYCLNYCTYGYTFPFWDWERWEGFIDWMMLAGYNLVLNPLGTESVWLTALQKIGYALDDARSFLCSPAIFPWQCMNNLTGWTGAASMSYYRKRLELAKKINVRLRSFGAEPVAPGWSGMVPADFEEHFPESHPIQQGLWCGVQRPAILTDNDPKFQIMGYYFYKSQKDLLGEFRYFSTDPFHEGGISSGVDLPEYAQACLRQMTEFSPNGVWFLQGWGSNPMREILKALPVEHVLIGDLSSEVHGLTDNFADYPWMYGTVDNFGGQRRFRGNLTVLINDPLEYICDENKSVVGISMFPEGVETDEMMFDVVADYALCDCQVQPDEWLRKRLKIRYGMDSESAFKAWQIIREYVYIGEEPRDSGLLSRPSLTVDHGICMTSVLRYDNRHLFDALKLMMVDYDHLCHGEAFRMDIMDIARQLIGNAAWEPIRQLQEAYFNKDLDAFEENVALLMRYYDLQEAVTGTDKHSLLGPWLADARAQGDTLAEKAYMEFQARNIITLWANREGSDELHDYAAREWDGMLQDFYRPRWESYINILRHSLVSGRKPMDYNRYDAEYFFTTLSKEYPTEPYGDAKQILQNVIEQFS